MNDGFVQITFFRKRAFVGALLPYALYVNGDFAGAIKNGETLVVRVPKSETYFLDESNDYYERNAIIRNCNSDKIDIVIKTSGGWRTASYNEFYLKNGMRLESIPSFDFEKYITAGCNEESFAKLTENDKVLSLCIDFENEIADGVDKVLTSENCMSMLDALRIIGANQYIEAIDGVIKTLFPDVPLPLGDDARENSAILAKLKQANRIVSEAEKTQYAYGDFHHAVISFILKHFV